MGLLSTLRRYQSGAPRLVATIIAVAWFGLTAGPCQAVANTADAGSSQHGSMPAGDCGHCLPATADPAQDCAMVDAAECLSLGQAIVESRETDKPQPALPPPSEFVNFDAFDPGVGFPTNAWAWPTPVSRVSVQKRYCTYLK